MTIYTIGYTKKSLRRFIDLLKEAQVDAVIDVRLHNTSQLAGFSKRDDLAFILETVGTDYHHLPELAPSEELLTAYQHDRDWAAYEKGFASLMAERDMLQSAKPVLERYRRPCLLCAEDKPNRCHRRLLAESLAAQLGNTEIKHLV